MNKIYPPIFNSVLQPWQRFHALYLHSAVESDVQSLSGIAITNHRVENNRKPHRHASGAFEGVKAMHFTKSEVLKGKSEMS